MSLIYETDPQMGIHGKRRTGLYLGGKVDAKNRDWLELKGISHILNVTPAKEACIKAGLANFFETSSFTYKRISVYDALTSDLLQYADSIVNFISTGLIHGSVLVHCQRGVSRSATCVGFYFIRKVGFTLDDAIALMKSKRPIVDPNPAFMEQLRVYEGKEWNAAKKRRQEKSENGDGKNNKKRKMIGPSMPPPSIGSSMPPLPESKPSLSIDLSVPPPPEATPSPSIGPSMPSSLPPPSRKPIGPSLPTGGKI